jgi:hypothetical protein
MRLWIPVIISFFIMACTQDLPKEGELIKANSIDSTDIMDGPILEKASLYRFYIPGIFTHNFKEDIDVSTEENTLSVDNGQLVAKKYRYKEQELTAISFEYSSPEQGIIKSASHLLSRDENGDLVDLMDEVFPELDVYAFYGFKDKKLKQLEGDEQTVFAGYHLDFSKTDSLGVQFMFCNKKDPADTDSLNMDGVVRYVSMEDF